MYRDILDENENCKKSVRRYSTGVTVPGTFRIFFRLDQHTKSSGRYRVWWTKCVSPVLPLVSGLTLPVPNTTTHVPVPAPVLFADVWTRDSVCSRWERGCHARLHICLLSNGVFDMKDFRFLYPSYTVFQCHIHDVAKRNVSKHAGRKGQHRVRTHGARALVVTWKQGENWSASTGTVPNNTQGPARTQMFLLSRRFYRWKSFISTGCWPVRGDL